MIGPPLGFPISGGQNFTSGGLRLISGKIFFFDKMAVDCQRPKKVLTTHSNIAMTPLSPPTALQVLLIDDEPSARQVIRTYLNEFCPKFQLVGEAGNVQDAIRLVRERRPGLLFLDIHMADGEGFDLLDKFDQPDFHVIFTTAHDEFALRAFRYSAVDYLLKPIGPDEFLRAVDKALRLRERPDFQHFLSLMQQPRQAAAFQKIALPSLEGITLVKLSNIVRLEANGGYTNFFMASGEHCLITRSIGEFEEILPQGSFFRVHVSHLVNLDFVKKFLREDGGYLLLEDNSKVPIARRRKDEFMEVLRRRVRF